MRILRKIAREITLKWRNPTRYFIERKILPRIKNKRVLLVGCADYTKSYPKKLAGNDVTTIDLDPFMKNYGAKKHIIGDIAQIDKYCEKSSFDCVLFFGIFGYGLNDQKKAEKTLKSIYKTLRYSGELIIGWSDIPGHNQIRPARLKSLKLFSRRSLYGFFPVCKTDKNKFIEFFVKNN